MSEDGLTKWEEAHEGALAASEVRRCLHCAGSRLLRRRKTAPYTAAQQRWMSIGTHFELIEREHLKAEGADWYRGRLAVLEGYAVPIRLTPDFVIREGSGLRIREVKFRQFPPAEIPLEWRYQAGIYGLRYGGAPVDFAVYGFDSRDVTTMAEPPGDLKLILAEWAETMRLVLAGGVELDELPHDPYWCKRSEWACEDCIGARIAGTELGPHEEWSLSEYLAMMAQAAVASGRVKAFEQCRDRAKEIAAAHGGEVVFQGYRFRLGRSRYERIDEKALTDEQRAALPMREVVQRQLSVRREEA